MAQVWQRSETWKQNRANMRASVSMRVRARACTPGVTARGPPKTGAAVCVQKGRRSRRRKDREFLPRVAHASAGSSFVSWIGSVRWNCRADLRDADEQRFRATMATWTRLAALLLCAPVSAQFGNLEVKWQKDETSKDAVPSMGPPEPEGRLDGQNRATNLQGLSSEGLEGIVKSFGLSCDTCTNAGHWISRVRSGGAHVAGGALVAGLGVTLPPSLLPRSSRDAAAPAQVAPQKARAQVRQMLAARELCGRVARQVPSAGLVSSLVQYFLDL